MDEQFERLLATINQIFVFKIPPQVSATGHRAADWPQQHSWEGICKIFAKGDDAFVRLFDRSNGQLFAEAPVAKNGPPAVLKVTDSSRYFVLRIVDAKSGRHAFIGIGFQQRSDAFDFNVALEDHRSQIERESSVQVQEPESTKDYSLKEGQTIHIKLNTGKKSKKETELVSEAKRQEGKLPTHDSQSQGQTSNTSGWVTF